MLWHISWFLSASTLVIAAILAWICSKKKRAKVKPFYVLLAGVFLSSVFMIYPIYRDAFNGDLAAAFKSLIISAENQVRLSPG